MKAKQNQTSVLVLLSDLYIFLLFILQNSESVKTPYTGKYRTSLSSRLKSEIIKWVNNGIVEYQGSAVDTNCKRSFFISKLKKTRLYWITLDTTVNKLYSTVGSQLYSVRWADLWTSLYQYTQCCWWTTTIKTKITYISNRVHFHPDINNIYIKHKQECIEDYCFRFHSRISCCPQLLLQCAVQQSPSQSPSDWRGLH